MATTALGVGHSTELPRRGSDFDAPCLAARASDPVEPALGMLLTMDMLDFVLSKKNLLFITYFHSY